MTYTPYVPISRQEYVLIMRKSDYGWKGGTVFCPSDILGVPSIVELDRGCNTTYGACKRCWTGVLDKVRFKGDAEHGVG